MTLAWILLTLLFLVSCFLMLVILLQRGRGGGLAGAFGGLGGQSAFGTKAGDVFTVITVITVAVWVLLACTAGWAVRNASESYMEGGEDEAEEAVDVAPEAGGKKRPAADEETDTGAGKSDKSSSPSGDEPGSGDDKADGSGKAGGESKSSGEKGSAKDDSDDK